MVEQSKHYTSIDPDACSCPGWYWRQRCRHVEELRQAVELVEANRRKWASMRVRSEVGPGNLQRAQPTTRGPTNAP